MRLFLIRAEENDPDSIIRQGVFRDLRNVQHQLWSEAVVHTLIIDQSETAVI